MEHLTVVSADGHIGMPYEGYRPYIDPGYRDRLDDLAQEQDMYVRLLFEPVAQMPAEIREAVDERGVWGLRRELYWDVDKRLAEMDAEGLAGEFVITTNDLAPFFSIMSPPYDLDVRAAGVRAFNRWAAEYMTRAQGRIHANGELPPTMEESVAELPWLAEHGFVSVTMPGLVAEPSLPPIYSREYDRFWATCQELGLALNVHAGWGTRQGVWQELFASMAAHGGMDMMATSGGAEGDFTEFLEQLDAKNPDSPLALTVLPQQVMWRLMLAGVFDRYPDLKFVLTEVRADWVPQMLAHLDKQFAEHGARTKLKPSEYFARNCAVTPSAPHRSEVQIRREIGVSQFLFGADIPHPEGTWPNTRQWIRDAFKGVPETEARLMLGENALRVYNRIDRAPIDAAAARIGFTAGEVFSGIELDPRVLGTFHGRAGYERAVDEVNIAQVDARLVPDLAQLGAR